MSNDQNQLNFNVKPKSFLTIKLFRTLIKEMKSLTEPFTSYRISRRRWRRRPEPELLLRPRRPLQHETEVRLRRPRNRSPSGFRQDEAQPLARPHQRARRLRPVPDGSGRGRRRRGSGSPDDGRVLQTAAASRRTGKDVLKDAGFGVVRAVFKSFMVRIYASS